MLAWLAFLLAFAVTVAGPVAVAARQRLRRGVSFRIFEVAAGFYLLNLVVQVPVFRGLAAAGVQAGVLLAPAIYSLSEEALRYLSFRAGQTMRGARTGDGALMAGLGHGAMEAGIFALILGWTVAMATFTPDVLRTQGIDPVQTLSGLPSSIVLFAAGRLAAIVCHIGFATLTVLAYRRSIAFLPLVAAAHFSVVATTSTLQARGGAWWVLAYIGWAAAAAAVALWARRGWLREEAAEATSEAVVPLPQ